MKSYESDFENERAQREKLLHTYDTLKAENNSLQQEKDSIAAKLQKVRAFDADLHIFCTIICTWVWWSSKHWIQLIETSPSEYWLQAGSDLMPIFSLQYEHVAGVSPSTGRSFSYDAVSEWCVWVCACMYVQICGCIIYGRESLYLGGEAVK